MKSQKTLWTTWITLVAALFFAVNCSPSQKPKVRAEIVDKKAPDGSIVQHELTYLDDRLIADTEIEEIGLYHGKGVMWNIEKGYKEIEGQWKYGYWTGEWRRFNEKGEVINITTYRTGSPIAYQELRNGKMVQIPKEEWPRDAKKRQGFPTGIKGELDGGPSPELAN